MSRGIAVTLDTVACLRDHFALRRHQHCAKNPIKSTPRKIHATEICPITANSGQTVPSGSIATNGNSLATLHLLQAMIPTYRYRSDWRWPLMMRCTRFWDGKARSYRNRYWTSSQGTFTLCLPPVSRRSQSTSSKRNPANRWRSFCGVARPLTGPRLPWFCAMSSRRSGGGSACFRQHRDSLNERRKKVSSASTMPESASASAPMSPAKARRHRQPADLRCLANSVTSGKASGEAQPLCLPAQARQRCTGQGIERPAAARTSIAPQSVTPAPRPRTFRPAMRAGRLRAKASFQKLDHHRLVPATGKRRFEPLFLLNVKASNHRKKEFEFLVAHQSVLPNL